MKIKMKVDADHRISSAKSQAFKAGRSYDVPASTANALIDRGVADAAVASSDKPSKTKEK